MSDDDKTPKGWRSQRPPARVQTADDRALASRRYHAPALGVPIVDFKPEPGHTTDAFELWEPARAERRRPGDSVLELAAKLRADRRDPYHLLAELGFEVIDAKNADRSANQELDRQFREFLSRQPGGEAFKKLSRTSSWASWAFKTAVVLGLGALGYLVDHAWNAAERIGEATIRLQHVEDAIHQLQHPEPKDKP